MEGAAQLVSVESQPLLPFALSISEILYCIFKELSIPDCVAAALACQTWVDAALDFIWKDLESPHPLLLLLGTITFGTNWDWDDGFPQTDWARFQSYSKRVHSITYDGGIYEGCGFALEHMSPEFPVKLLYYVAINQGTYLLPRNRAIRWVATQDCELQLLIPLIFSVTDEFSIDVSGCTLQASSRLLRALSRLLLPNLRVFHFKSIPEETPDEDVRTIIRLQNSLQELKVPSLALEPIMLKPGLRVLEARCTADSGLTPKQLVDALADACPLLRDIRLTFARECHLTFDSIRPLLRCSKLKSLDLEYPGRWDLDKSDVKAMGKAWRRLEALNLCSRRDYPGLQSSHGIPMSMLPRFARYFSHRLRKLALFLNTEDMPRLPYEAISFPNLKFFAVGTSPLGSEMAVSAVTAYLDAVLPPRVERIYSSSTARQNSSVFDPFTPRFHQNPAWENVEKSLSTLRKEFGGRAMS